MDERGNGDWYLIYERRRRRRDVFNLEMSNEDSEEIFVIYGRCKCRGF